jgi:hypothetical protein
MHNSSKHSLALNAIEVIAKQLWPSINEVEFLFNIGKKGNTVYQWGIQARHLTITTIIITFPDNFSIEEHIEVIAFEIANLIDKEDWVVRETLSAALTERGII